MNVFRRRVMIIATVLTLFASGYARADVCAPLSGKIDPEVSAALVKAASQNKLYRFGGTASEVAFCVDRALAKRVRGTFGEYYGSLAMPLGPQEEGQVVLLVRANSLTTGDEFIDNMARGPSFFHVEEHPDILFVSRDIEWLNMTNARLHGNLTMHGVTKPITFDVELKSPPGDGSAHADQLHLSAVTEVDRADFNMDSFPVMLSSRVRLCIEFEARLVRAEA